MATGRFTGDAAIHAFGPRKVISLSAVLAGGGLWLALLPNSSWLAIIGFALVGIGLANIVPILFRAAGSVPGIPAATGLAAVTTCGYSGFLFGPPLIGFVAQARTLGFALGGIACLCLAVAIAGPRVVRTLSQRMI
jgi:fucose permease